MRKPRTKIKDTKDTRLEINNLRKYHRCAHPYLPDVNSLRLRRGAHPAGFKGNMGAARSLGDQGINSCIRGRWVFLNRALYSRRDSVTEAQSQAGLDQPARLAVGGGIAKAALLSS